MNLGQLLGGAGVVGQGMRQAEEAERVSRQNQLAIEEQNRVADLKKQLAGLQMPSFQPMDMAQFTQQFMPGQAMPMGAAEAPPAAAPVMPGAAAPMGGARPLLAGVQPSQAGAGRGVVNPPLVGQPQPQVGAVTAPVTPQTNLVATTLPPAIESLGRQFDAARTQYRQAQDALRQFGLRQRQQNPSGFAAAVAAEAAAKQALGEAQNAYETGVSPYAKPLQAGGIRLPALAPAAAPAAPGAAPAAPAAPGVAPAGATRSDRNNNPGNLIYNKYTVGLGATGKDKDGFAIFPSPEVGQAASLANLQSYGQQGINTIAGVINKWSPPNAKGNTPKGTQNYVNFVSQQLGIAPDQQLDMTNPATLQALNAAIRQFEGTGAKTAAPVAVAAPAVAAAPGAAAAPGGPPAALEVPQTQARNMEMAEFYLANPESIPYELQQVNQMAQQQSAFLTRERNEAAQLAQVYMRSGTQQGIDAAMRLRENIGQLDASLMQIQQQVGQKQAYLQGMQGLRELATANDPRRLSGVLTQFMGAPVGIQPRPDGKYNYFINGKKVQDGVSPAQLAAMALKEFSPEARAASAQSAQLENELALKRKYGDAMVNAMRDIQKAMIDGEYKIAEERAKQLQGKLTIDTSKGVAYFQQGNRVFVINPDGKVEETPLGKVELPPTARPVAGLNMGR